MGLGGAMYWAVDLDDFSGKFCNYGEYPLINSVKFHIKSSKTKAQTSLPDKNGISNTYKNMHINTTPKIQQYETVSYNSNKIHETTHHYKQNIYEQYSSPIPQTSTSNPSDSAYLNLNPASTNFNNRPDLSTQTYQKLVPSYNNFNFNSVFSNLDYELIERGQATNHICRKDGLFADRSTGCQLFYQCVYSNTMFAKQYRFRCPENTIFSQNHLVCDWVGKTQC
jgi:hypothetical protein